MNMKLKANTFFYIAWSNIRAMILTPLQSFFNATYLSGEHSKTKTKSAVPS